MESQQEEVKPKKFSFFGYSAPSILGIIMIVTSFFVFLIGVFMIAYSFMVKPQQPQQPPPKKQKKTKQKPKEEVTQPQPPLEVVQTEIKKEEDQIKNEVKTILEDDYNNDAISPKIVEQSDTEVEQEVKDEEDD